MEERVIVKSKSSFKIIMVILSFLLIISLFDLVDAMADRTQKLNKHKEEDHVGLAGQWYDQRGCEECDSIEESQANRATTDLAVSFACIVIWLFFRKYEITVTDKRIYGRASFGRYVEMPLESVTGVSCSRFFKLVTVATYSGKARFWCISNPTSIYITISDMLERKSMNNNGNDSLVADIAEELKEYQELLTAGMITEEEYEEKRKQILGL